MTRLFRIWGLAVLATIVACSGTGPTGPIGTTPAPPPAPVGSTRPVQINGIATDDGGAPVAGAAIEVTVSDGVTGRKFYATTNPAGFYELTADVLVARRAIGYIKADSPGRDRYFAYFDGDQSVTQDVRLYRPIRITVGESTRVTVVPGDSACGLSDELICRTVRLTVPAAGPLTMTCEPRGDDNGGPGLTIVGYNERTASPSVFFVPGEHPIEVGMWLTSTISQSCLLTTAFSGG